MLKIDVEGYEGYVLRGGHKTLMSEELEAVVVELNGSGELYGESDETSDKLLRQYGFQPVSYDPFSRTLEPIPSFPVTGNAIYIKNLNKVRERLTAAPLRKINGVVF